MTDKKETISLSVFDKIPGQLRLYVNGYHGREKVWIYFDEKNDIHRVGIKGDFGAPVYPETRDHIDRWVSAFIAGKSWDELVEAAKTKTPIEWQDLNAQLLAM